MWLEERSIVATAVEWSVTNIAVLILLACFYSCLHFKTSFFYLLGCKSLHLFRHYLCNGYCSKFPSFSCMLGTDFILTAFSGGYKIGKWCYYPVCLNWFNLGWTKVEIELANQFQVLYVGIAKRMTEERIFYYKPLLHCRGI